MNPNDSEISEPKPRRKYWDMSFIPPQASVDALTRAIEGGQSWHEVDLRAVPSASPKSALNFLAWCLEARWGLEGAQEFAGRFMENKNATTQSPSSAEALSILTALINPDVIPPLSCVKRQRLKKQKLDPNQNALDFEANVLDVEELKTEQNTTFIARLYCAFDDRGMACCPVHDDSNPSFNLFESTDGAWLCGCFGCQWTGNIAQLVARIEGIEYDEAVEKCFAILDGDEDAKAQFLTESRAKLSDRPTVSEQWWQLPVHSEYVYTDKEGQPSFKVQRREEWVEKDGIKTRVSKHFPIFHLLDKRWVTGKGGSYDKTLFHLPQLLSAPVVMLCEGEKDVLTAEAQGFVATTNAGGAANLKAQHVEWLRGKTVIDASDNDNAGRTRSALLARFGAGIVNNIIPIVWPPEVKDLTDFFEKGHATNELLTS